MNSKIFKGLLVGSLLASSAFAGVYAGFDYGNDRSTRSSHMDTINKSTYAVTTTDSSDTYNFTYSSIKLGYETSGYWKYQIRASQTDWGGKSLNDIGFDILKEFEMTKDFFPYIKIGGGYGWRKLESGYSRSTVHINSFETGLGISYKMFQHVSLNAGIDYVYRTWDDFSYDNSTTDTVYSIHENILRSYIGVDYTF